MSLSGWLISRTLPYVPKALVAPVARRYIAGETLEEGLATAAGLNARGFRTTLDLLGEDTTRPEQATRALADYLEALRALDAEGIDGNVSVKPTQFGLRIDADLCHRLFSELAGEAHRLGHFVRVEMEDSTCTDRTLALFRRLARDFDNVGIVLQSCLRRTRADLEALLDLTPNVRMVKGVYVERPEIAWQERDAIRSSYVELSRTLVAQGSFVAFATHDEYLVDEALRMVADHGAPASQHEFQMLLGVRPELGDRLVRGGQTVRVYVPFGKDWYPYSTRRLRENPRIAGYVLKALVRRPRRAA